MCIYSRLRMAALKKAFTWCAATSWIGLVTHGIDSIISSQSKYLKIEIHLVKPNPNPVIIPRGQVICTFSPGHYGTTGSSRLMPHSKFLLIILNRIILGIHTNLTCKTRRFPDVEVCLFIDLYNSLAHCCCCPRYHHIPHTFA